jgi:hypothetical protein
MEYRSAEHHEGDVVASVLGIEVTVGLLRRAFEQYFGLPFSDYQREPDSAIVQEKLARATRLHDMLGRRCVTAQGAGD